MTKKTASVSVIAVRMPSVLRYCVTVDHQTLEDNCVTLRNRDTMQQERVAISELNNIIADRVSITVFAENAAIKRYI